MKLGEEVPIEVTIIDTSSGERRIAKPSVFLYATVQQQFMTGELYICCFSWDEGNQSCDCNRGCMFFDDHDLEFN